MSKNAEKISILRPAENNKLSAVALYSAHVSAGFPSPADDYVEKTLDLNEHLIVKPSATFFVRVQGDSMEDVGIYPGSLLIVDRSLEAFNNSIVLAILDGEFTIKRFRKINGRVFLYPENKNYKPIEITSENQFEIWGVVRHTIQSFV